jgi:hypothetical protein
MLQTATAPKELTDTELQNEYVSGGGGYASITLSLESVDRLRNNLTAQTRAAMRYDSEVESSVEFLLDAVFADGIAPVPVITDDEDEEFALSKEIADFVAKATGGDTPRTLASVVREVARDAFYSGVKTGEIVLKVADNGNLILDRVNPKPNSSVSFVCDRFNNVLGLTSWNRNYSITEIVAKQDEIIPREKFLIIQFELEDNHPGGVSKIRAAYDDWCDKKLTRDQYKEWRRTSAIPKKVGITHQGATERKVFGADGKPKMNGSIPETVSPQKDMLTALEGFANNSSVAVPHSADVKQLEVQGTGEQFVKALKYNNSGIRKAILGDSVSTGEDDKGVKAAKEVSMDVVNLRIKFTKNTIADAVRRDVYRLLTVVNFGADKVHLTPRCSLGDTERRDWEATLNALSTAGWEMTDEQMREGDVIAGFTPRDKNWKREPEPKPQPPIEDAVAGAGEEE